MCIYVYCLHGFIPMLLNQRVEILICNYKINWFIIAFEWIGVEGNNNILQRVKLQIFVVLDDRVVCVHLRFNEW